MSQSEVTSETWHLRIVEKFIAINLGRSNECISFGDEHAKLPVKIENVRHSL